MRALVARNARNATLPLQLPRGRARPARHGLNWSRGTPRTVRRHGKCRRRRDGLLAKRERVLEISAPSSEAIASSVWCDTSQHQRALAPRNGRGGRPGVAVSGALPPGTRSRSSGRQATTARTPSRRSFLVLGARVLACSALRAVGLNGRMGNGANSLCQASVRTIVCPVVP